MENDLALLLAVPSETVTAYSPARALKTIVATNEVEETKRTD